MEDSEVGVIAAENGEPHEISRGAKAFQLLADYKVWQLRVGSVAQVTVGGWPACVLVLERSTSLRAETVRLKRDLLGHACQAGASRRAQGLCAGAPGG